MQQVAFQILADPNAVYPKSDFFERPTHFPACIKKYILQATSIADSISFLLYEIFFYWHFASVFKYVRPFSAKECF